MKLEKCKQCGKDTAEGLNLCPDCMKKAGATAEEIKTAKELRDIALVLSITANKGSNIKKAMDGILNIADKLERLEALK